VLSIEDIRSGYGRSEVLHGVNLEVRRGEVVTLIGANGAGKTTLLLAISGIQPVRSGSIAFEGDSLGSVPAHLRVARGIAQVPEGRQIFAPLSVADNLRLGAWRRAGSAHRDDIERICDLLPILREKLAVPAGTLSGGQQQLLAIGRALMARPRLLLLDEPSMGLAPNIVDQVFAVLRMLKNEGLTILLVEQNARAALAFADRAYVLETGRIMLSGTAAEIRDNRQVRQAYLGI
jgi:branched-chain amino acid transport system ATP-binding protein